ncbi:hypothetical protein BRX36_20450 [Sphingomonas sp. S-NIH.Pt1_0416]|jgi:hypothetical protein|nr:hypothetical protein BRX36_20450 [Sphingomonas sp. S-NIH.Pt1_0416]
MASTLADNSSTRPCASGRKGEQKIAPFASRRRYDCKRLHVGVSTDLSSCHTALVDGMAFEGHVPIVDMKRALTQRPKWVRGLAVAGMPLGSPGMEMPGRPAQPYAVVAFGPAEQRLFARH